MGSGHGKMKDFVMDVALTDISIGMTRSAISAKVQIMSWHIALTRRDQKPAIYVVMAIFEANALS